jgi:hypothetical protein
MTSSSYSHLPPPDDAFQAALERELERDERNFWNRVQVLVLVLLPLIGIFTWLTFFGYQRHVLLIRTSAGNIRLVSHAGPFEVSDPNLDFAPIVSGGSFSYISDRVTSDSIQPRSYDWAAIASTLQTVVLPDGQTALEFYINNRRFSLDNATLVHDDKLWKLTPGQTLDIDVDRLPDPFADPDFLR